MIIPAPHMVSALPTTFPLGPSAKVCASAELLDMAERFVSDLAADGGPVLSVAATGEVRLSVRDDVRSWQGLPDAVGVVPTGRQSSDERYRLRVDDTGVAVTGATEEGLFRGLTSLRQLICVSARDANGSYALEGCDVADGPRFAWRGLSLDVVRYFSTPDEVRVVIDMLALYKFNVLHLHLTDNEGWRLEIAGRPEITAHGPYYSRDEFASLVEYAGERFITVVPEIDLPGHSQWLLQVYPHLGEVRPTPISPIAYLDPRLPETFEVVSDALTQLADLTPGPFLHIGGDEAFGMPAELYEEFLPLLIERVLGVGKTPVGWQEVARAGDGRVPLLQLWMTGVAPSSEEPPPANRPTFPSEVAALLKEHFGRAHEDLGLAKGLGAKILLSSNQVAYFDIPHGDVAGDPAQEPDRRRLGLPHYRPQSLEALYDWDASTLVAGLDEHELAGLEAAVWCESVDDVSDLQFLITSRLPGFAERCWSAPGHRSWVEFSGRLGRQSPVWRSRGWRYFASSSVDWA